MTRRNMPKLRRAFGGGLDLILPRSCRLCDGLVSGRTEHGEPHYCPACHDTLQKDVQTSFCPRCASSVGPGEIRDDRCRACMHRRLAIDATVRLGTYAGATGDLLRRFKFQRRPGAGADLAGRLSEHVRRCPWFDSVEAVVVVPTVWHRRLMHPSYSAGVLAADLARSIDRPLAPMLRRRRGGRHQIGLSYRDRIHNVRGAFALRTGVSLDGGCLLLVDDVKTTGATLGECAKVLRDAGAETVYAAVIATADWDPTTGTGLDTA